MQKEAAKTNLEEKYKEIVKSTYNEILERLLRRFDASGTLGEEGETSPSYRLDFDLNKQEAVFEIFQNNGFVEEKRSYIFTIDTARLEGYRDTEMQRNEYDRTVYFTTYKDTSFLLPDDVIADPLDVDFEELELVHRLVLDPRGNADLVERLQPLIPAPSQFQK